MRKIIAPLLLLCVVVLGFLIFYKSNQDTLDLSHNNPQEQATSEAGMQLRSGMPESRNYSDLNSTSSANPEDAFDLPATQVYHSAQEALAAVVKGANTYDDVILDQFVDLGPGCSWCNEFYDSVKALVFDKSADQDERAYLAEIMAISGRTENAQLLIDALKQAGSDDDSDLYSESVELIYASNPEIMNLLSQELNSDNEVLQESVLAAITDAPLSTQAAEVLYNYTVKKGDPDGDYSIGLGLGELVPDNDTLPYLKDKALKRDQYSHLAIKAMLNNGLDGLKEVVDVLTNSKDAEFDRQMLKDAPDHVLYEDDIQTYLEDVAEKAKDPVILEFAKQVLSELNEETDYSEDGQSGVNG